MLERWRTKKNTGAVDTRSVRWRLESRQRRHASELDPRALAKRLVSLAGVVGADVVGPGNVSLGRLVDIVTRWDGDTPYPPVTGIVVRVGRRHSWVPAAEIARMERDRVRLRTAKVDLRDFERRHGEVALVQEVLDHQVIDVDGVRVVRVGDLYLTNTHDAIRLVGVDVGFMTLLRRVGRAKARRAIPESVIDWADVQAFGSHGGFGDGRATKLTSASAVLERLGPGDLAEIVERLNRADQKVVLDSVEVARAADMLEEMDIATVRRLFQEMSPERAAALLEAMEADEAAELLRGLGKRARQALSEALPTDVAETLNGLAGYSSKVAGGVMNTSFVTAQLSDTVASVRTAVSAFVALHGDVDAVAVVDEDGFAVDDVTIAELFCASDNDRLHVLVKPPLARSVKPADALETVTARLLSSRRSSIVVVDDTGRPVGRVAADDLLDDLSGSA